MSLAIRRKTRRPPRARHYYLWDRATQRGTFLFATQPALEKLPPVKMTPVEIKARDGLTLVSYLSLPAAADPDGSGTPKAPVPMVLLVRGGPWGHLGGRYLPLSKAELEASSMQVKDGKAGIPGL